jgi:hypothetical protein
VLSNDRPLKLALKKKSLYSGIQGSDLERILGKQHQDLIQDIGTMRLQAEKERIELFRSIARDQGMKYYKLLAKIIQEQLFENFDIVNYFTDFIKYTIENGQYFSNAHLEKILRTFKPEEMTEEINTLTKFISVIFEI